jgi:nucleotide-binding universal stress UspA family protein
MRVLAAVDSGLSEQEGLLALGRWLRLDEKDELVRADGRPFPGLSKRLSGFSGGDVLLVKAGRPPRDGRLRALLALDGSEPSLRAVQAFLRKTDVRRADIRVLHAGARAALEAEGVPFVEEVHGARPGEAILGAAMRHRIDVVVMGASGRDARPPVSLGRVTQRILRQSDASVLVAL